MACHVPSYVDKYDVLKGLKTGGSFLLNSVHDAETTCATLPDHMKVFLAKNKINFYIINATKIAAELGISQCTVYTELKRGQKTDEWTGETVLDHNFRPEYKAERGEKTYQSNLRKRGRRPKAAPSMKGV